jgi:DNA-directed RNA polymerase subunit RPC12/RpoP
MSSEVSQSVECSECNYAFHDDELDRDLEKRIPCPNCGSFRRTVHVTVKDNLVLHEYIGLKAKKPSSTHKKSRADYEFEEGKKKGKNGRLVYKKLVRDREHAASDNSYQELVIDVETGKVIVDKHERLSKHR